MSNLASNIEIYIKRLLAASPNATLLLQRKDLAERFQCVPSQINYVLSTRFTVERGYLVESRRGEGGYLRIRHLDLNRAKVVQLLEMLSDLPCGIATTEALDFINRLTEARMVTRREGQLMKVALTQNVQVSEELLCITRTKLLIRMLEILLQDS